MLFLSALEFLAVCDLKREFEQAQGGKGKIRVVPGSEREGRQAQVKPVTATRCWAALSLLCSLLPLALSLSPDTTLPLLTLGTTPALTSLTHTAAAARSHDERCWFGLSAQKHGNKMGKLEFRKMMTTETLWINHQKKLWVGSHNFSCEGAAQHLYLCSVCPSVCPWSKLNFFLFTPLYTPLCLFMPLCAPLCLFMPLYAPFCPFIPL